MFSTAHMVEQHCHEMIEHLRREYERATKPYVDMLVRLRELEMPTYITPIPEETHPCQSVT